VLDDPPMTTDLASPLLGSPGAVSGEGVDAPVAAHYGDPMREQRLLVERLAAVDLSHRPVITITGADRISWLHSLTTQHLSGLGSRTSRESLILSPKGHVEHNLHLLARLDELVATEFPVVIGTSRKRFLGALLAEADGLPPGQLVPVDDRLEGSVATAVWAMEHGARMVRVHDVAVTARAARAAVG